MNIGRKHLEFLWGVIITGFAISFIGDNLSNWVQDPVNSSLLLFILVLAALLSLKHDKKLTRNQYEQEFRLFSEAKDLIPEHFQYKKAKPGEKLNNSDRPYYDTYIERKLVPYDSGSSVNEIAYSEQELVDLIDQGKSILLIGNPTEGKTRTLFEVIRKLNNFLVIWISTDKSPSDGALELLKGRKVLWLFDDLNIYNNQTYDFQFLFSNLKNISKQCVLAATCREGPELKDINLNTGQLHKIYDLFDHKLILKSATDEQKDKLKNAIGETATKPFPTLGSICMHKHFEFMRERFNLLTEYEKDSLRSILLLYAGFIYPFTQKRIKAVLTDIFDHKEDKLDVATTRISLNNLISNGFITSQKDIEPILPEAAYITEPESKFYYPKNRNLQEDMVKLAKSLKEHKDADGLNKLAASRYFSDDKNFAWLIWGQLIAEFKDSEDVSLLKQVAEALIIKGIVLGQLGKSEEAIECYDDLVQRYGTRGELVLQEKIAQALVNKGVTLGQLRKSEEAIECYGDLVQRYGTSGELVSQEQIAKALFNKGVTLGQLGKSEEAIECYDDLVQRYGTSGELVLQEQIAKALFNKGFRLGQRGKSEEAIECYGDLVQRYGTSGELVLQEQIAKALFNKGVTLGQLGKSEEAIECYDDLVQRYGTSGELVLQEQIAKALFNKGFRLGQLGKSEEEIECYDKVIQLFEQTKEPVLQKLVANAHQLRNRQ